MTAWEAETSIRPPPEARGYESDGPQCSRRFPGKAARKILHQSAEVLTPVHCIRGAPGTAKRRRDMRRHEAAGERLARRALLGRLPADGRIRSAADCTAAAS